MKIKKTIKLIISFLVVVILTGTYPLSAEMIERVVAIVDDEIVLLSEFQESLSMSKASGAGLSDDEVINQMINRIILLGEAKKFGMSRISVGRDDVNIIINEFINRRIKAFIHISYNDIEKYYFESDSFKNKEFYDVKDEIEQLLISRELVKRLREYITELRQKTHIRVQLIE